MNRLNFFKSLFGIGVLSVVGSKMDGKFHVFSEEIKEDGTVISGTLSFTNRAYADMTEAEFKELWEREMDFIKRSAWPDVLKERNRLLASRSKI